MTSLKCLAVLAVLCVCSVVRADERSDAESMSMQAAYSLFLAITDKDCVDLNVPDYAWFATCPLLSAENRATAATIVAEMDVLYGTMASKLGEAVGAIGEGQTEYAAGTDAFGRYDYVEAFTHWGRSYLKAGEASTRAIEALSARQQGIQKMERLYSLFILQP